MWFSMVWSCGFDHGVGVCSVFSLRFSLWFTVFCVVVSRLPFLNGEKCCCGCVSVKGAIFKPTVFKPSWLSHDGPSERTCCSPQKHKKTRSTTNSSSTTEVWRKSRLTHRWASKIFRGSTGLTSQRSPTRRLRITPPLLFHLQSAL